MAQQSPADLLDTRVGLEDLWGSDARRLQESLVHADDASGAATVISEAIAERGARGPADDPAVREAVRLIERTAGQLTVSSLARHVGVPERRLRDRMTTAIGYGPKLLARVMRFQAATTLLRDAEFDLADVALATGYFDQAHLTRDVTALAGISPSRYRAETSKTGVGTIAS